MRQDLKREHICKNLEKEFVIVPKRKGILMIVSACCIALLSLAIKQYSITILTVVFAIIGILECKKAVGWKKLIEENKFLVEEAVCTGKRICASKSGQNRTLNFGKNRSYITAANEKNIWEKAQVSDGFYLICLENSKEIKKIYPMKILAYKDEY